MAILLNQLGKLPPEAQNQLKNRGIRDTNDFLRAARGHAEPTEFARALGLEPDLISDLTHVAELTRIRGIGLVYIRMLSAAGITTISQLAAQCPEELQARLAMLNAQNRVAGRVPTVAMVNGWITKAQRAVRGEGGTSTGIMAGRQSSSEERSAVPSMAG